jgi:F-type H+-transporting ATPase subunit c
MESSLIGPAAALAIGLTGMGVALAQGRAAAAALEGVARNPGAAGTVRANMILGLGMMESCLALVLAFLATNVV